MICTKILWENVIASRSHSNSTSRQERERERERERVPIYFEFKQKSRSEEKLEVSTVWSSFISLGSGKGLASFRKLNNSGWLVCLVWGVYLLRLRRKTLSWISSLNCIPPRPQILRSLSRVITELVWYLLRSRKSVVTQRSFGKSVGYVTTQGRTAKETTIVRETVYFFDSYRF